MGRQAEQFKTIGGAGSNTVLRGIYGAMNKLREFSDSELLEELARRDNRRDLKGDRRSRIKWCDECVHFLAWAAKYGPIDTYNPCELSHGMSFAMPKHSTASDWGFFKKVCVDRSPTHEP